MKNIMKNMLSLLFVFGVLTTVAVAGSCPSNNGKFCSVYKNAELGRFSAMNKLGELYEHGKGVARNQQEAYIWYTVAHSFDYADAKRNLRRQWDLTASEKQSAKKEAKQRYSQIRKQINTAWWE